MVEEYLKLKNNRMFLTFRRIGKWNGLSYPTVSKCHKISGILGKLCRQVIGQIVENNKLGHYSIGFPGGSDRKESACNAEDLGSIPGLESSHGEGKGYPFQDSCLENPFDRGACGIAKSWT